MTPQKVSVLPVDPHRDGGLVEKARETLLNEKHTLRAGVGDLCFHKPSRGFWSELEFENHCCCLGLSL